MTKEAHIVVISEDSGKRSVERHEVRIPIAVATGHYHRVSDRALNDIIKDLTHEQMRRQEWL